MTLTGGYLENAGFYYPQKPVIFNWNSFLFDYTAIGCFTIILAPPLILDKTGFDWLLLAALAVLLPITGFNWLLLASKLVF